MRVNILIMNFSTIEKFFIIACPFPPVADVNFKNIELVDRKEELKQLNDYLNMVKEGRGKTVFISGEAGIGKTRIVEELIKQSDSMGFKIIRGQCLPESLEPLFPFKSALKRANLEYLLSNKPPPLVLSAYLIDESGLVIAKAERQETNLDPDIFAGMLTAIEAFVKDSLKIMGTEENASLNALSYGDYNILIQSSGNLSLATVIKGEPSEFLIDDMKRILQELQDGLEEWHGVEDKTGDTKKKIEWFITSKKYDGRYLAGEPSIVQENIFDNIVMGLQRVSERNPLIVFIDDMQWADKTSLNLFYYLSKNIKNNRILMVGTYRPEEIIPVGGHLHPLEIVLNNLAGDGLLKIIGLPRLSREDTGILISRILGDYHYKVGEKIYKESGGNPLFVIETIKLLLSEKLIRKDGKKWKLMARAEKIIIPKKAYELIKRRLERLSDEEREILDVASVVGEEFDTAILALTTMMDELKILKLLNNIYRKHKLIYEKDGKYRFEHSIIREVLYNELLDELRRKYHKIIGDIIYELNKDNLSPVINTLAYHYYEARDSKAVKFLIELGDRSRKNYANYEAIEFYMRALELADDQNTKLKILENLGDIYLYTGEYDVAIKRYREALDAANNPLDKVRLNRKIADILSKMGDYEGSLKILNESIKMVPRNESIVVGRIHRDIGTVYFMRGEYQKALEEFRHALRIITTSKGKGVDTKRDLGDILRGVGNIHLVLGDYEKAKKYYTKSLEIMKEIGDMKEVAEVLSEMGNVYLTLGDLDRALRIYSSSLGIMQNVGYKYGIATLLNSIGNVYYRRGDLGKALEHYQKSFEISDKINQLGLKVSVLNNLGMILYLMDEMEDALEKFKECLKISKEIGDRHTSTRVLLNIGRIYMEKKKPDYAKKILTNVKSMLLEIGDKSGYAEVLITLSEVHLSLREIDEAEVCTREAIEISGDIGSKDMEMIARRAMGAVMRDRGDYRRAIIELTKAMRYFKSSANNFELARTYYEFGLLWLRKKEYDTARESLERAMEIYSAMNIKLWVRHCREAMKLLR